MRGVPTPGTLRMGTPRVGWCKQLLRTHGWTVEDMEYNTGGQRIYPVTSPEGLDYDLTTYGLRRIAWKLHTGKNPQEISPSPVDNAPDTGYNRQTKGTP